MTTETRTETHGFQTEVKQLLHLMIHSLYSNKDIFLRELISNASDAAEKLRFEALSNGALYENDGDLKIKISFDKDAKTLTIEDNGIGMSRDDVVEHLGTIAKSGTSQFLSQLTGDQSKDSQLIGQFGVGFYSSFIVADRVEVFTRKAGLPVAEGVHWSSEGEGEFSIGDIEKASRGTQIVLHLKEGEESFADGFALRGLVRKYSDHISIPVLMQKEATPDMGSEDEPKEAAAAELEDETVNSATALWTRNKSDSNRRRVSGVLQTHLPRFQRFAMAWVHNSVEGNLWSIH